jgi:hypothetical protein
MIYLKKSYDEEHTWICRALMNERYDNFKGSIKRQRQNSININHCRAEFQKIFSNGKKN